MPWNPLTTPVGWPVAASLQGLAVRWVGRVGRVGGQSERFDGRLVEDHAIVEVLHPDRIVRRRGGELLRCGQPPFGKLTDLPAAGRGQRTVQDWEAGINHPSAERLQALIQVLFEAGGLTVGHESAEAQELWAAVLREARSGAHVRTLQSDRRYERVDITASPA